MFGLVSILTALLASVLVPDLPEVDSGLLQSLPIKQVPTSLDGLRKVDGEGRSLSASQTRSAYNACVQRLPIVYDFLQDRGDTEIEGEDSGSSTPPPSSNKGNTFSKCEVAEALFSYRRLCRLYARERGPWWTEVFVRLRDLWEHGSPHGPTFSSLLEKYSNKLSSSGSGRKKKEEVMVEGSESPCDHIISSSMR